jgi:hypothetical protein
MRARSSIDHEYILGELIGVGGMAATTLLRTPASLASQ